MDRYLKIWETGAGFDFMYMPQNSIGDSCLVGKPKFQLY